mgnify:CR=1 FL=1
MRVRVRVREIEKDGDRVKKNERDTMKGRQKERKRNIEIKRK